MPQLDFSTYPSQIFWLLICMSFLVSFMKRVFVPRMNGIFDARDKRIYGDLERVKGIKETVQSLQKEYKDQVGRNKINAYCQQEDQLTKFDLLREEHALHLSRSFFRKRVLLEKERRLDIMIEKKFQNILLKN